MKRILTAVIAATLSLGALAQARTDLSIGMLLDGSKQKAKIMPSPAYGKVTKTDSISVIATATADAVESIGRFASVKAYAGGTAVIRIAVSDLQTLRHTEGVSYIKSPAKVKRHMSKARQTGAVDKAQQGLDLPQGYDGTGVTVGVIDAGFDYTHKAFTDAEGNLRIRSVSMADPEDMIFTQTTDPEDIIALGTDLLTATHGTHTTSIAAGRDLGNGMGGVAQNADIALVAMPYSPPDEPGDEDMETGDFEDEDMEMDFEGEDEEEEDTDASANLLACVQEAVARLKELGKPAVLNMSLGINDGPRDGSSPESNFFREISRDNIIVMSAGNEGNSDIAVRHTFSEDGESVYIGLKNLAGSPQLGGEIMFWSDDDQPLQLEFSLVSDNTQGSLGTLFTLTESTDLEPVYVSGTDTPEAELLASAMGEDAMLAYLAGLNPDNNRYTAGLAINEALWLDFETGNTIAPLIKITGHKGQTVRGYFDNPDKCGFTSIDYLDLPWMQNTGDGSINTLAIDTDVILVGAYADRGDDRQEANTIGIFSSWANLVDGTTLPHVIAPGYEIIAAYNSLCDEKYSDEKPLPEYAVTIDGNEQKYVPMSGTSMSSPYVCGVVALWLQANPELTPAQIREIISHTSDKSVLSQSDLDLATYGAGLINAYESLKYILTEIPTSIQTAGNLPKPLVKVVGRTIEVTTSANEPCRAALYSTTGQLAATSHGNIDASALPSGIYLLTVGNRASFKIVLK